MPRPYSSNPKYAHRLKISPALLQRLLDLCPDNSVEEVISKYADRHERSFNDPMTFGVTELLIKMERLYEILMLIKASNIDLLEMHIAEVSGELIRMREASIRMAELTASYDSGKVPESGNNEG